MFKNNIIFIFIITFLCSCGYTPVYVNSNAGEFQIEMVEFKGDPTTNKFINLNLKQYYKPQGEKKYLITMNSKYLKNSISKDKTGKTTEYKLIVNVDFKIMIDESERSLNFSESFLMKGMDNMLDERDYERNLLQTLSSIITQKLLTELSKL